MVYKWQESNIADGYRQHDPQLIGKHLCETLVAKYRTLTAPIVLADAKKPDSPLHPLFEWDDSKAANEYRNVQARRLTKAIVIVRPSSMREEREKEVLTTVRVSHSDGREHDGYVPTAQTRNNPHYRQQVVDKALREMAAWLSRYNDLAELETLRGAIEVNWPSWDTERKKLVRAAAVM